MRRPRSEDEWYLRQRSSQTAAQALLCSSYLFKVTGTRRTGQWSISWADTHALLTASTNPSRGSRGDGRRCFRELHSLNGAAVPSLFQIEVRVSPWKAFSRNSSPARWYFQHTHPNCSTICTKGNALGALLSAGRVTEAARGVKPAGVPRASKYCIPSQICTLYSNQFTLAPRSASIPYGAGRKAGCLSETC